MPDFWQFPTGSMGLGPIQAIYQARFMRYLENRGILQTAGRKVWAFPGDGRWTSPSRWPPVARRARGTGQPDLRRQLQSAAPGRARAGNGSIIQELEGLFAGAGWNVVKLIWGSDWDPLFARDHDGVLLQRLHETVDGEFQKYAQRTAASTVSTSSTSTRSCRRWWRTCLTMTSTACAAAATTR